MNLLIPFLIFSCLTTMATASTNWTQDGGDDGVSGLLGVIGGKPASPDAHPFMVSLQYNKDGDDNFTHRCGASILTDDAILTAAHCVVTVEGPERLRILVTHHSNIARSQPESVLPVKSYVMHPEYRGAGSPTYGFDIAVIRLTDERRIDLDKPNVSQVCLPRLEAKADGGQCFVIGWGITGPGGLKRGPRPVDLQQVTIPLRTHAECRKWRPVPATVICAGDARAGACFGDSGGPLMCPVAGAPKITLQYGIVSFGIGDCFRGPSYFTQVADYIDWILSETE